MSPAQGELFSNDELRVGGFVRLGRAGKTSTHLLHVSSGWEIRHCGHPTANWPYYLVDPSAPDEIVIAPNGRGFRLLAEAKDAVLAARCRLLLPSRRLMRTPRENPRETC